MNFTAIVCCYVLLPYFASLVAPPQEATTCSAGPCQWIKSLKKHVYFWRRVVPTDGPKTDEPELKNNWFAQNVDHYHFTNLKTWDQRYLVNDEHYDNKGTVFILIGTHEEITSGYMRTGRWIQYAKEVHALCIGIEIRFYGQSVPNKNFEDKNLEYLNIEQALADVAWFIVNFKHTTQYIMPEKIKWVAFGRFEEGNLAAWLKMKFPHLIDAAFALSAPLLAKANYNEYFEAIETLLNSEKPFKAAVAEVFEEIEKKLAEKKYEYLETTFNLCKKRINESYVVLLNDEQNIKYMYFVFAQILSEIMQYSKDMSKDIKKEAVIAMTDLRASKYSKLNILQRFGVVIKLAMSKYEPGCLSIDYQRAINNYKITDMSGSSSILFPLPITLGTRSYLYQCCSEFGYFQTFEDGHNFFKSTFTLNFYVGICTEVFGIQFNIHFLDKGIHRTNLFYGGLDIIVSHVVFVYAELDPLRKLGLSDPKTEDSVTFILKDAYQCEELDNVDYVPQINDIKGKIIKQIKDWLNLP